MNPSLVPVAPAARASAGASTPRPLLPLPRGQRLGHLELQGLLADTAVADKPGLAGSDDADCLLYRAWDQGLARRVVIAEYLPQRLARRGPGGVLRPLTTAAVPAYTEGMKRFIEHSRALAAADDPSLVRVLHLVQTLGTAYRVMPWTAGERLQWLRRRMAVPPDETALRTLLDELLDALQALHRGGHVHGSVHPGRILMLESDRALLLAPAAGAGARDGFAAPEQFGADAAGATGPWSDCHALAQVARFCISGLLPDALAPPEALAATVERLYFDRPEVRYSPGLLQVLDLAASPDRARRPQTAAQFRAWLAQPPLDLAPMPAEASFHTAAEPAPVAADTAQAETEAHTATATEADPDAAAAAATLRFIQGAVESSSRRRDPPLHDDLASTPDAAEPSLPPAPTSAAPRHTDPLDGLHALRPMPSLPPPRRRPVATLAMLAVVVAAGASAFMLHEPALQWLETWQARNGSGATPGGAAEAPAATSAVAAAEMAANMAAEAAATKVSTVPAAALLPAPATAAPSLPPTAAAGPAAPLAAVPGRTPATGSAKPSRRSADPRQQCGERTRFALYRCMQSLCAQATWQRHAQCVRLRRSDRID